MSPSGIPPYPPARLCCPQFALEKRQKLNRSKSKQLLTAKVNLSAVKNQKTLFFSLSPMSLLLGVIQCSNKLIMDDKQPIFGRQSVSLPNLFVAENIVHYLPNFVAMWNPPLYRSLFTKFVLPLGIPPSKY